MLHNKFFSLLVTFLWMGGLFSVVLTLAYIQMEYRRHRFDEYYAWNVPRILAPLYASLATFCLGLTLHALVSERPISLLIAIVWGILAAVFAVRTMVVLSTGVRQGWDISLDPPAPHPDSTNESPQRSWFSIWSGAVLALLVVNLLVLSWWGSSLIMAGGEGPPRSPDAQGAITPARVTADSLPNKPAEQAAVMETPTIASAAITVPVNAKIEPTSEVLPPVPTLAVEATAVITNSAVAAQVPTETLTPTAEVITPSVTIRSVDGANVRRGPELTAEIMTVLLDSTEAPVLGRTSDNQWFLIALPDGESGWISLLVVEPNETIENAPVVMPE
jgi:uncharacterized protein YgiM (DUF1202 family)